MKIGILGSGDVAKSLAAGFLKHGHEAMLGTRDPAKLADWTAEHRNAKAGTFSDAAAFGEVVVLAVKGAVAAEALHAAGPRTSREKLSSMRSTRSPTLRLSTAS